MISAPRAVRAARLARRVGDAPSAICAVYAVLAVLLLAYLVSLIVRSEGQSNVFVDGWLVAAFEIVVSCLCIARAFGSRRRRAIPLILGLSLLSWGIGDALQTAQTAGGGTLSTPSISDLFWLGFYPVAYVGMVLLMRRYVRKLGPVTWLDGAVAGLGAAAVCACFAFNTILHTVGGSATPAAVATDLAYPVGDVLLLILAVGGTAIMPGRKNPQWLLLAAAIAVNALGDTFNLFATSGSTSHLGTSRRRRLAYIDPAHLLLGVAASGALQPAGAAAAAGFLLPGLGACAGLAILLAGTVHRITPVAIGLATATLVMVGVRLGLSVRQLRSLTEKRHRQAITDELTGLGNRRHLF